MNTKKCLLIFALLFTFTGFSQNNAGNDTAAVNKMLDESKAAMGTDSAKAKSLALKAKELAHDLDYSKGEAYALKNIGMVHYVRGQYVQTLDYWNQSLDLFEKIKDDVGIANMLSNIGAIYFNQGADDKALEYTLKSLQLAEKLGDTVRMIYALSNIGSIYHNKKEPVALTYLLKAIPLVERSGNTEAYVGITGNIGEVYFDGNDNTRAIEYFLKSIKAGGNSAEVAFSYNGLGKVYLKQGQLQKALENHTTALKIAEKADDKFQMVRSLRGMADVYEKQNNSAVALDYYKKARLIAEQMDDVKVELKDLYKDMSGVYAKNNDFSNAYFYQTLYSNIKDTLYNLETKKKLNQLQFDFELSKKEGELSLNEAKLKSEKQAKTGVMLGLGLLLIIVIIVYRNYLQKAKVNRILDQQKVEIEELLLNILPKQVAHELRTTGNSKPQHFDEVSILFTDFKGFTSIADKLSPEEVVQELNECFMAFDNIMEKYGLEKIKTIGDAYMCAGNLPLPNPNHTYKIIKAALEMQDFIAKSNKRREEKGLETWEIRIGVHIGPVVAGVVGKKKYAYDIWGSAVNIASRMESNGQPGKVNISATMYEVIKGQFECSHRGRVYAKNLGELDMYFVDGEKTSSQTVAVQTGDSALSALV